MWLASMFDGTDNLLASLIYEWIMVDYLVLLILLYNKQFNLDTVSPDLPGTGLLSNKGYNVI